MMYNRIILAIDPKARAESPEIPSSLPTCTSRIYSSWQAFLQSIDASTGPTLFVDIGHLPEPAQEAAELSAFDSCPEDEADIRSETNTSCDEDRLKTYQPSLKPTAAHIVAEFQRMSRLMCPLARSEKFLRDLHDLSTRQSEVLELILQGQSCKEIAARLDVGLATAAKHRVQVFKKLCVRNVVELVQLLNSALANMTSQPVV